MSPIHVFQFYLFSVCVYIFTIISYIVYYSDRLSSVESLQTEYDYIIVGSGTAGSVIAHRLFTETNHTFIVLEAGARSHVLLEIPVLGPFLHKSVFDWHFQTVRQDGACLAMEGQTCRIPQGKVVGGSSKLNNMIYMRGNISHYLDWFHGKYSEEYITRQFQYIEDNIFHINEMQYQSELSDAVLQAAKELGYQPLGSNFSKGFTKSKLSQKKGKRWSPSDLLIKNVVSNAVVENIIFTGNTAVGVSVDILNKKRNIYATKGVINAAGALNTPKILQLSGIGPENVLKNLNIPIRKVLPVGKNLQDHVASGLDLVLFNKTVSVNSFDMINPFNALNYFINGQGPLTTPGCEAIGFISTNKEVAPDLQYMILPVGLSSDKGSLLKNILGIKEDVFQNYHEKIFDNYVGTFLAVVLHPKSRGEVYITSRDVSQDPVIDPKYLSHKNDRKVLTEGLKFLKTILETKAMKNLGGYLNTHKFPGCDNYEFFTDLYLDCYISHLTLSSYHPVGTCSMGLPDSKNTVVDLSFKVLGVVNLFVADASVLPTMPSGNINAAVAMMASMFFETNIRKTNGFKLGYCSKNDRFYEEIYKVCVRKCDSEILI